MIKNFERGSVVGGINERVPFHWFNGFAMGATGVRDAKIYCNEVSGEIETDSPKVKAITNYNRWLAQEVLRRNAESK